MALRQELPNSAAAYAMDRVADPFPACSMHTDGSATQPTSLQTIFDEMLKCITSTNGAALACRSELLQDAHHVSTKGQKVWFQVEDAKFAHHSIT